MRILYTLLFIVATLRLDAQVKPKLYIFTVGIKDYKGNYDLLYADKDAEEIAAAFQQQYDLYQVRPPKILVNQDATAANIRQGFSDFAEQVNPDDLFVFFYSGHGLDKSGWRMCPYEFDTQNVFGTSVGQSEIYHLLNSLGCNYAVLLDACFSGSFIASGGKDIYDDDGRKAAVERINRQLMEALSGTDKTQITITSGASDRKSYECQQCKNGYFAQAILDVLENKFFTDSYNSTVQPDQNGDGYLAIYEFSIYVQEAVKHMTAKDRRLNPGIETQKAHSSPVTPYLGLPFLKTKANNTAPRGIPDRDGDGTPDKADNCPDEYGTVSGCPDTDGDGIPDHSDDCIYEKGTKERNGCPAPPDYDNDGVPDVSDKCKYKKGQARWQGCPDSDGDNIPDHLDECPDEKGKADRDGCPVVDLPDMVFVKGGTFEMGSEDGYDDEKPVHSVTLSDYYLNKYEVTFDEYDAFCDEIGKEKPDDRGYGRGRHPVINVSWNDAVAYCNWRSGQEGLQRVYVISGETTVTVDWSANGYRLPTEAEWEYAARSRGGNDKWAGTSSESSLLAYANNLSYIDGYGNLAPVGSFSPNSLGLHDMSGNVKEWCWDRKGDYPDASQTDPRGGLGSYRVVRGGSCWTSNTSLRCTYRDKRPSFSSDNNVGFRLAKAAR